MKYRILGLMVLLSFGITNVDAAKSFGNRLKSIFSSASTSKGSAPSVRAQTDTPVRSFDDGVSLRHDDKGQVVGMVTDGQRRRTVVEDGEIVSSEVIPDAAPVLQRQQAPVAKKPSGKMSWLTESVPVAAINYAFHKLERSAIGAFKPKDTKAQKAATQRLDAAKVRLDQSLASAKVLPKSVKKKAQTRLGARSILVEKPLVAVASTQQPLLVRKPSVSDVQRHVEMSEVAPVRPQEAPRALEVEDGSRTLAEAVTRRAESQEARKKIATELVRLEAEAGVVSKQRSTLSGEISRLKGVLRDLAAKGLTEGLVEGLARLAELETQRLALAEQHHGMHSRIDGTELAEVKIGGKDLGAVKASYAGEATDFRRGLETLSRLAREGKAKPLHASESAPEVIPVVPVRLQEAPRALEVEDGSRTLAEAVTRHAESQEAHKKIATELERVEKEIGRVRGARREHADQIKAAEARIKSFEDEIQRHDKDIADTEKLIKEAAERGIEGDEIYHLKDGKSPSTFVTKEGYDNYRLLQTGARVEPLKRVLEEYKKNKQAYVKALPEAESNLQLVRKKLVLYADVNLSELERRQLDLTVQLARQENELMEASFKKDQIVAKSLDPSKVAGEFEQALEAALRKHPIPERVTSFMDLRTMVYDALRDFENPAIPVAQTYLRLRKLANGGRTSALEKQLCEKAIELLLSDKTDGRSMYTERFVAKMNNRIKAEAIEQARAQKAKTEELVRLEAEAGVLSKQRSILSGEISRLKGALQDLAATARPAEDLEAGLAKLAGLETQRLALAEQHHGMHSRIDGTELAEVKIDGKDLEAVKTRYAGEAADFRRGLETLSRLAREGKAKPPRASESAPEGIPVAPVRVVEPPVV